MSFDIGTIIAIAAVLLFYLRLIIIQRRKGQQAQAHKDRNPRSTKNIKQKDNPSRKDNPSASGSKPISRFEIRNGYLVGAGVLIILTGVIVTSVPQVPALVQSGWWLFITLGVILMSFGIH